MVYKWKTPGLFNVPAQVAGEELQRIYDENGTLEPSKVVDESRAEDAPLHKCFEWRDDVAAEKYREVQARKIIRMVVTVTEQTTESGPVRAFAHVEKNYEPMSVIIRNAGKMDQLLANAYRDLRAFREKYGTLKKLQPVFDAIDQLVLDLPA